MWPSNTLFIDDVAVYSSLDPYFIGLSQWFPNQKPTPFSSVRYVGHMYTRIRFEPPGFPVAVGKGRLAGTLTAEGLPVPRRVYLYADYMGRAGNLGEHRDFLASLMTDSGGNWEFTNLPMNQTYTVISFDTDNEYDPAIKGGLVPEPM